MLTFECKEPSTKVRGCLIWLHGLGANAADMTGLAAHPDISALPLRHIFLNAPMRAVTINAGMQMPAWYDILGFSHDTREDADGVKESAKAIQEIIEQQIAAGFAAHQIFLAGFSQGGAIGLYTALHSNLELGGVVSLSSYLPLASEANANLPKSTPLFIGLGEFDPVVLPAWTKQSELWLFLHGYTNITSRQYPIEHSISSDEIHDLCVWLQQLIQEKTV